MSDMEWKKIDSYTISYRQCISTGTGHIYSATIYDFLNMQLFRANRTYREDGGASLSTPTSFSDLESLEGVKMAYETLKDQGGTPPEVNWPKSDTVKKTDVVDIRARRPSAFTR